LILLGASIATLGPIPMFFGMGIANFVIFIIIISLAEAIYAPILNVFCFQFTKVGREGTFLTLTATPVYFTLAATGIAGGFLLENYYPVEETEDKKKQPWVIWFIVFCCSLSSTLILFLFRPYFDCAYEDEDEKAARKALRKSRKSKSQNSRTPRSKNPS